jgi:hypothetical protein
MMDRCITPYRCSPLFSGGKLAWRTTSGRRDRRSRLSALFRMTPSLLFEMFPHRSAKEAPRRMIASTWRQSMLPHEKMTESAPHPAAPPSHRCASSSSRACACLPKMSLVSSWWRQAHLHHVRKSYASLLAPVRFSCRPALSIHIGSVSCKRKQFLLIQSWSERERRRRSSSHTLLASTIFVL